MQKEEKDLRDRTKAFALRVVRMFSALPKTTEAQVLGNQVQDNRDRLDPEYLDFLQSLNHGRRPTDPVWSDASYIFSIVAGKIVTGGNPETMLMILWLRTENLWCPPEVPGEVL